MTKKRSPLIKWSTVVTILCLLAAVSGCARTPTEPQEKEVTVEQPALKSKEEVLFLEEEEARSEESTDSSPAAEGLLRQKSTNENDDMERLDQGAL